MILPIQLIAFGVSSNLNFQSESHLPLFSRTWQKRPTEPDPRYRFEIGEMTLQIQ